MPEDKRRSYLSDVDSLEDMVEAHGLQSMIGALVDICRAKELHLREQYGPQDATAKLWASVAVELYNLCQHTKVVTLKNLEGR